MNSLALQRTKICNIDCGYCIEPLWKTYRKKVTVTQFMWHYYVIWYVFSRATDFSRMQWSSFVNNWRGRRDFLCWQCMVYYKHPWNLWNGNTRPLDDHMGQAIMHGDVGRPYATLLGVAAHGVLLSPFLPPGKRLWNSYLRNNSIDFGNSRCFAFESP